MKRTKIYLTSQENCTGCAACAAVCPKECISFQTFNTLHLYPSIDLEQCIKCGKCMDTCPALHPLEVFNGSEKFYAAWNRNINQRKNSTSGGIGSALTEFAIENGWYVCGSAFNNEWYLSHKIGNTRSIIDEIKQSKYLQSNTENIYIELKKILKHHKVLFIGTPCQVAAAIKVCGKDINLLTVEIICHGVNSPFVWQDYISYIQEKEKSKLIQYNFRDKSHGWQRKRGGGNLCVSMSFENNKHFYQKARYNLFHYWFGQHFLLREACLKCSYRTPERAADITIGDFWGINNIYPNIDTFLGISVLICRSIKSFEILNKLNIEFLEVKREDALKLLKGYIQKKTNEECNKEIEKMKKFQNAYLTSNFEKMRLNYNVPSKLSHFKARLKSLIRK